MQIQPRPGAGLTHAHTRHLTPYGLVDVAWKIENGAFTLDLTLPANTSALVILPGADAPVEVGSGVWRWTTPYQDPDARGPYTVDDLVSDLFFDPAARKTILATLEELGVPEFVRRRLPDETSATLRQVLQRLPNYEEAVTKIDEALKTL